MLTLTTALEQGLPDLHARRGDDGGRIMTDWLWQVAWLANGAAHSA